MIRLLPRVHQRRSWKLGRIPQFFFQFHRKSSQGSFHAFGTALFNSRSFEITSDFIVISFFSNIFSTFNLGSKIDLKSVMLTLLNAEYHPSLSSRVTLRLANPNTSARVFHNGKVDCIGAVSLESAKLATRKCADLIKACGFPVIIVYHVTSFLFI